MKKDATNSEILKQVLYEMLTLAYSIEILTKNKWIKGHSLIDSSEAIKTTALIKIRLLYNFLYCEKSGGRTKIIKDDHTEDDYTAKDNFKVTVPKPSFVGCGLNGMFSDQSISKYLIHLTEERIKKSKEIPEPKFKGGDDSIIKNSALLLSSAEKFIDTLLNENFMNLNQEGGNYFADFKKTITRLKESSIFNLSY